MAEEGFGWNVLKWAWANKGEILNSLKRVRDWFRAAPERGILIIGPGGVGKTTLARVLSGEFDWLLDEPWRYDVSYGVEEFALKDDPKVEIVVMPGQPPRREAFWVEVERNLASGQYRGVILVNANGYHSLPDQSYKAHRLYRGNKDEFLTAYLEACRADERAVLERVVAGVQVAAGKVWLMSVVGKEDLWWSSSRDVARASYEDGPYAEVIATLAAAKGVDQFRHELVPASLVISNFRTGENETLAKNVEGYDHKQQVESLRRLFEVLDALREWEEAK